MKKRDILFGCEEVIWVRPPCIEEPRRNYRLETSATEDEDARHKLGFRSPTTVGGGAQAPINVPTLTGVADDPLAAEVAIAELIAEEQALDQDIEDIQIPSDLEAVDAYMVHMYRKLLGGPYKEGTFRSQRDLFGVCID